MHHGILINKQFYNEDFPFQFTIFNKKQAGSWLILGIELNDDQLTNTVNQIQENMKPGTWYTHLYNNEELIVIFKKKTFTVKPDKRTWGPILAYGESLHIPKAQLDFVPHKFADETEYFEASD